MVIINLRFNIWIKMELNLLSKQYRRSIYNKNINSCINIQKNSQHFQSRDDQKNISQST